MIHILWNYEMLALTDFYIRIKYVLTKIPLDRTMDRSRIYLQRTQARQVSTLVNFL